MYMTVYDDILKAVEDYVEKCGPKYRRNAVLSAINVWTNRYENWTKKLEGIYIEQYYPPNIALTEDEKKWIDIVEKHMNYSLEEPQYEVEEYVPSVEDFTQDGQYTEDEAKCYIATMREMARDSDIVLDVEDWISLEGINPVTGKTSYTWFLMENTPQAIQEYMDNWNSKVDGMNNEVEKDRAKVVERIGEESADEMFEKYGGLPKYLPIDFNDGSWERHEHNGQVMFLNKKDFARFKEVRQRAEQQGKDFNNLKNSANDYSEELGNTDKVLSDASKDISKLDGSELEKALSSKAEVLHLLDKIEKVTDMGNKRNPVIKKQKILLESAKASENWKGFNTDKFIEDVKIPTKQLKRINVAIKDMRKLYKK